MSTTIPDSNSLQSYQQLLPPNDYNKVNNNNYNNNNTINITITTDTIATTPIPPPLPPFPPQLSAASSCVQGEASVPSACSGEERSGTCVNASAPSPAMLSAPSPHFPPTVDPPLSCLSRPAAHQHRNSAMYEQRASSYEQRGNVSSIMTLPPPPQLPSTSLLSLYPSPHVILAQLQQPSLWNRLLTGCTGRDLLCKIFQYAVELVRCGIRVYTAMKEKYLASILTLLQRLGILRYIAMLRRPKSRSAAAAVAAAATGSTSLSAVAPIAAALSSSSTPAQLVAMDTSSALAASPPPLHIPKNVDVERGEGDWDGHLYELAQAAASGRQLLRLGRWWHDMQAVRHSIMELYGGKREQESREEREEEIEFREHEHRHAHMRDNNRSRRTSLDNLRAMPRASIYSERRTWPSLANEQQIAYESESESECSAGEAEEEEDNERSWLDWLLSVIDLGNCCLGLIIDAADDVEFLASMGILPAVLEQPASRTSAVLWVASSFVDVTMCVYYMAEYVGEQRTLRARLIAEYTKELEREEMSRSLPVDEHAADPSKSPPIDAQSLSLPIEPLLASSCPPPWTDRDSLTPSPVCTLSARSSPIHNVAVPIATTQLSHSLSLPAAPRISLCTPDCELDCVHIESLCLVRYVGELGLSLCTLAQMHDRHCAPVLAISGALSAIGTLMKRAATHARYKYSKGLSRTPSYAAFYE